MDPNDGVAHRFDLAWRPPFREAIFRRLCSRQVLDLDHLSYVPSLQKDRRLRKAATVVSRIRKRTELRQALLGLGLRVVGAPHGSTVALEAQRNQTAE